MEQHFLIKPGQPIEMALVILTSFPNYLIRAENRKWKGEFWSEYYDQNMWTTSTGDPEYSSQKKPKRTFPFELTEISGIFGIMESTPDFSFALNNFFPWLFPDLWQP